MDESGIGFSTGSKKIPLEQIVNDLLHKSHNQYQNCDAISGQKFKANLENSKNLNVQFISNYPNASKIPSQYTDFDKAFSGLGNNGFRNSKSNIIFEQTTTTHTTTTKTVKVKGHEDVTLNYGSQRLGVGLGQTGGLGDKVALIQQFWEPLYSDAPLSQKEIESKSRWINEAYGSITEKSTYKSQLLKLVEYNKIEICENDGILEQRTEIEVIICKQMRQRLTNEDLKHEIDTYPFQGLLTEQQSLVYSIIKLTKKSINTLYKKCQNVIMTKSVDKDRKRSCQVLLKDLMTNSKDYIDIARKMGDLYEDMVKKAAQFRPTTAKIFDTQSGFRYVQCESLVKGFFFLFIYKDFVLREIISLMNEMLRTKISQMLSQVETDYEIFMESELVEWVNLMLSCGAFQSYSSIVTPYEAIEFKKGSNGAKVQTRINEGSNYYQLQKRYMKIFLKVHQKIAQQRPTKFMVDTSYDEDDEIQNSEMDEIFSISQPSDEFDKDDSDLDDCSNNFIFNSRIKQRKNGKGSKDNYNSILGNYTHEQLFQLNNIYEQMNCEDCKKAIMSSSSTAQQCLIHQKYSNQILINMRNSSIANQGNSNVFDDNDDFLLDQHLDLTKSESQTQEGADGQGKKKKKRRKNKKKKKKTPGEGESAQTAGTLEKTNGDEDVPGGACSYNDDQNMSDDPEFEENLKQFQIRLQQQINEASVPQRNGVVYKLKPNISSDWLLTMKEKCKSYSNSISRVEQESTTTTLVS